jgi:hypothetical protein
MTIQNRLNRQTLWVTITFVVIITILISACAVTPAETGAASTQPLSEPAVTPTAEPTLDPAILAEAEVNQEIYNLMGIFDDGLGLVNSYDSKSVPSEDYELLTEQQKAALVSEKMIDQAYAVLIYIRIGKMEDARRVLSAMQGMLDGDMADYVDQNGGGRSIGWWHIAAQQYYLLEPDPSLINFMQWCDYKGYWRQPAYYSEVFEKRITGEREGFWENETNIESLVQTIFYLKLDEKYGLETIYAVNNPEYKVEEQRAQIYTRFDAMADNLKQVLYYGDETGLHLIEGYTLLDTYTNAVIMACLLEREYPEQFKMADVNIEGLFERIETDYAILLDDRYPLYKAANEQEILPSFEAALQVANAYLTAAENYDFRKAHPELVQQYADQGLTYVRVDDAKAIEYRLKAETIIADVWELTTSAGYPSIPLLEKNNTVYSKFGPLGFRAPAMSSLAQYVQFKKGTFFEPLETAVSLPGLPAQLEEPTQEGAIVPTCVIAQDSLDDKYRNFNAYNDWNDPEFVNIRQDLEGRGLHYLVEIISENGQVSYHLLLMKDDPRLQQ